jgi:hypothetical protein
VPTDLGTLEPQLATEIGATADFLERMKFLLAAVPAFNGMVPRPFDLFGTQLDRFATPIEARALVVVAAWLHAKHIQMESAANAIVHSNVAGRTDLTGVYKAWGSRIALYENELGIGVDVAGARVQTQTLGLITKLNVAAIEGETVANELGETRTILAQRPMFWSDWPYW